MTIAGITSLRGSRCRWPGWCRPRGIGRCRLLERRRALVGVGDVIALVDRVVRLGDSGCQGGISGGPRSDLQAKACRRRAAEPQHRERDLRKPSERLPLHGGGSFTTEAAGRFGCSR